MTEPYSHRNGETEAPTAEGLFWMREDKEGGTVVQISRRKEILEVWVIGSGFELIFEQLSVDTQWWGPLTPPWGNE